MNLLRGNLKNNISLAPYTTWRIGGAARQFYHPADLIDLQCFLMQRNDCDNLFWLGSGSNLLVADAGYSGTVIFPRDVLNHCALVSDFVVNVESGVSCAALLRFCLQKKLTGCEFLVGIPGSVGGALIMNAGAFGGSFWNLVEYVNTIDKNGRVCRRLPKDYVISYRQVKGPQNEWFLSAALRLQLDSASNIQMRMKKNMTARIAKHPLNLPSCGSVFKNTTTESAGELIENCGLKGKSIGGAQISTKHANFIVNNGGATAADVKKLMAEIQNCVQAKYGIMLAPEVKFLG